METMITFAGVTIATVVALFAALALESLLLKAMFVLMQPLAMSQGKTQGIPSRGARMPVERGTRLLMQAYGKTR
jgi:hypothetical protein